MPPPRKVAIIYPFFPHYRASVMTELLERGQHEYVLVGDRRPLHPSIKPWGPPPGVPFVEAPNWRIRGHWVYQRRLIGVALRRDIHTLVVHLNPYWIGICLASLFGRLTGKRVIYWNHGWTRREGRLKRAMRRLVYGLCHEYMLYGHLAKMLGVEEGLDPRRLHVIYNSLDVPAQRPLRISGEPEEIRSIRREAGLEPDLPVVICTSRLVIERELEKLVEAAGILRREGHHVQVLLVGDGPERGKLERATAEHGADVHFYGACYDEPTLARLVGCANVTVAPARLGLTAMHSLTYGTPAVTHDQWEDQMPETEAVIPGRTGSFYRRGNIADLAEHIRQWTRTPLPDPRVRRDCYELIDRFWNPQFQRWAIERAIDGLPADDLFWMKETPPADVRAKPVREQAVAVGDLSE